MREKRAKNLKAFLDAGTWQQNVARLYAIMDRRWDWLDRIPTAEDISQKVIELARICERGLAMGEYTNTTSIDGIAVTAWSDDEEYKISFSLDTWTAQDNINDLRAGEGAGNPAIRGMHRIVGVVDEAYEIGYRDGMEDGALACADDMRKTLSKYSR